MKNGPLVSDRVTSLVTACYSHAKKSGIVIVSEMLASADVLMKWLDALSKTRLTGVADDLLIGVNSAIGESASAAVLGLARAGLLALRSEVDMLLAWLYFKDHAVEWQHCNETGDGFKLKSEIFKYLKENLDGFKKRLDFLEQSSDPDVNDIYRFLSAHIHGQRIDAIPVTSDLVSHVDPPSALALPKYQRLVGDYLANVLCAYYGKEWANFGPSVMGRIDLLTKPQKQVFFA